jgi:hypothetical protein
MARRLLPALIVCCAALVAPATAGAADLHAHDEGAAEPRTGKEALRLARAIRSGDAPAKTGRELSPVLRSLAEKLPELDGADRRRAERLLARPTSAQEANPGESVYEVPEAPPLCGQHFCVHYVTTTKAGPPTADQCRNPADDRPDLADANVNGVPDYVEVMLGEFEAVHAVENEQLGWREPKTDFNRGGNDLTDVYIKNIGPEGIFGYAAPDARQPVTDRHRLAAYLVMDNDYCQREYRNYPNFLAPLQVTAAHEYNHVLQFNYDAQQDNWMFESTAVWMEDRVFDDINDYRNYLPRWSRLSLTPLTQFNSQNAADDTNVKVYGDAVFNRWIDEHFGPDTIRLAWEKSVAEKSFAPGAYDAALRERGTSFYKVFTRFAAETSEWRTGNGLFEEGDAFPGIDRALEGDALEPQTRSRERSDYVEGGINHTSYALFNVNPRGERNVTVGATFRRGVAGAIALVGRTGDEVGGTPVVRLKRMPNGGRGRVTLPNSTSYTRVTAVLINADIAVSGYSSDLGDWLWLGDDEPITLALNDFSTPRLTKSAPKRNQHGVSRRTAIRLTFDEGLGGISGRSVRLLAPGGRSVRATLSQSRNGRIVVIRPSRPLSPGRRYTVTLSADVTDGGGNLLRSAQRKLRFTTGR